MKRALFVLAALLLAPISVLHAAGLSLTSPMDYQVVQRETKEKGRIPVNGKLDDAEAATGAAIEARLVTGGKAGEWQKLAARFTGTAFEATMEAPAGGWSRVEVRAMAGGKTVGEAAVEHVGVGEVFVVAGQSNSANHGEQKQTTRTGRIATFTGKKWQLSNDPQPGASGGGGSFMPPLGDGIVAKLDVPVGFVACGIGASSVRQWLPKGTKIANPPTLLFDVQKTAGGEWECKGGNYQMFINRMKQLGPGGFRAVLWHQGESDANQADKSKTLAGKHYRAYLELLIKESRKEIGWEVPWFVALVSYHVPGDEASADIREAQTSLWKDGIALEGPDSDSLKRPWRENGGRGVHFSGPGLVEHAKLWAEKVGPWVEKQ